MGGRNGLTLFQLLAAVLTDFIAGVALFELAGLLVAYNDRIVLVQVGLIAAVTFMPVVLTVGLPVFGVIVFMGLADRDTIGKERLKGFATGRCIHRKQDHEIECNRITVIQSQLITVVGDRFTGVGLDLVGQGLLISPDILTIGKMIDNTQDGVGSGQNIAAAAIGYKNIVKTLGKQYFQFLGDTACSIRAACNGERISVCGTGKIPVHTETVITVGKRNIFVFACGFRRCNRCYHLFSRRGEDRQCQNQRQQQTNDSFHYHPSIPENSRNFLLKTQSNGSFAMHFE